MKPVIYSLTIDCDKCNEKLTLDLDIYEYEIDYYEEGSTTKFGFCYEPEKFNWKVIKGRNKENPSDKTYRCSKCSV